MRNGKLDRLRREVKAWRDSGYSGASPTSVALLAWWFKMDHPVLQSDGSSFTFRYYFAQREAVETVMCLHEIVKAKDKCDLMRFDCTGGAVLSGAPAFPPGRRGAVAQGDSSSCFPLIDKHFPPLLAYRAMAGWPLSR